MEGICKATAGLLFRYPKSAILQLLCSALRDEGITSRDGFSWFCDDGKHAWKPLSMHHASRTMVIHSSTVLWNSSLLGICTSSYCFSILSSLTYLVPLACLELGVSMFSSLLEGQHHLLTGLPASGSSLPILALWHLQIIFIECKWKRPLNFLKLGGLGTLFPCWQLYFEEFRQVWMAKPT